jgi:hypothetical protein
MEITWFAKMELMEAVPKIHAMQFHLMQRQNIYMHDGLADPGERKRTSQQKSQ